MHFYPDINECSSNPCLNGGTCTDQINRYICACPVWTEGVSCETGKYLVPALIIMMLYPLRLQELRSLGLEMKFTVHHIAYFIWVSRFEVQWIHPFSICVRACFFLKKILYELFRWFKLHSKPFNYKFIIYIKFQLFSLISNVTPHLNFFFLFGIN